VKTKLPVFSAAQLAREKWRPIPDFLGCFVSNIGRIRGGQRGNEHIRKQSLQSGGYAVVFVRGVNRSKQIQVSRTVASVFIRNPKIGEVINHLNGNRLDNRAANLQWTSQKTNIHHSNNMGLRKGPSLFVQKMTEFEKGEIRRFYDYVGKSLISDIYGIKSTESLGIKNG
jgi:hypothetical protein